MARPGRALETRKDAHTIPAPATATILGALPEMKSTATTASPAMRTPRLSPTGLAATMPVRTKSAAPAHDPPAR